jgi:hypothetical protein
MITRDISLEDCILDLIDNSVDNAWRLEGGHPTDLDQHVDLTKYTVEISATESGFSIVDNCGGMSLKIAEEYAFTFGRKITENFENFSIGVYGIGMKRAVFKIGEKIEVHSTYVDQGKSKSFRVPIDVPAWLAVENEKQWDFPIFDAKPLTRPGVEIVVSTLTSDTSTSFGSPQFQNDLRRIIARDYMLHLHYGLNINLNGKPVKGWNIELRESEAFQSARESYEDKTDKRGSVRVEIIAGMASAPPDTNDADDAESDDRFGWYVVCNGRVVLAGDKTVASGWGTDGWPQWHGQYNGFVGIIMFSSANAALLPLTTTKRSVDTSSGVYRRSLPKMREVSKTWTSYTNFRKQSLDEAKVAEAATRPMTIFSIPRREAVSLPRLTPKPKERVANINYSMPLARVRKLAAAFGNINMQYREIGIRTFDYAYDENVGVD